MLKPFDWIEIPGRRGTMKTNEDNVTLSIPTERYWIAKYPVTNAQFHQFMDANGYYNEHWWTAVGWKVREREHYMEPRYWNNSEFNGDTQPVVGVSWFEAIAFCSWLSEVTGETIMLPTEAQWQYAAQGDDNRVYPWGNEWDCERCNNSVIPCGSTVTTPVTQYEGKGNSPFGVVDMAGNVWEWCLTDYVSGENDVSISTTRRVLRGGSWRNGVTDFFRCFNRADWNPHFEDLTNGFRISRS